MAWRAWRGTGVALRGDLYVCYRETSTSCGRTEPTVKQVSFRARLFLILLGFALIPTIVLPAAWEGTAAGGTATEGSAGVRDAAKRHAGNGNRAATGTGAGAGGRARNGTARVGATGGARAEEPPHADPFRHRAAAA